MEKNCQIEKEKKTKPKIRIEKTKIFLYKLNLLIINFI